MITLLLALLILASWVFWLTAAFLVWKFFHTPQTSAAKSCLPVSILKPVKGIDRGAYENFASFCRQEYPEFEILFGVAEPDDPVIALIEKLQHEFPTVPIRLVVAQPDMPNRKISLLSHLVKEAHYPLICASDSDMRVKPDYLWRVIQPLNDPHIGLVTCPYKGAQPRTLTARLECLYMGVTFLPSMLVGRKVLHMRFAVGATVALRRADLEQIGGFEAIGDYLADDYELGARIAATGLKVHLSDNIIDSILGETTFPEQWEREVRWAHCNQVSRPWQYPGLILSFSTPLAILLVLAAGFAPWAWGMLGISLTLRWGVGSLVTQWTDDQEGRHWLFWLPVRDCLTALVWCAGIVGRKVIWRGEVFTLRAGGRLVPGEDQIPFAESWLGRRLRSGIQLLDHFLIQVYRIFEFDQDENVLFRLSLHPAQRELTLPTGTEINKGDTVAILHFWNEHMPQIPASGATLNWAITFRRQMDHSLHELAVYIAHDPAMQRVTAFHGIPTFGTDHMEKLISRWGFERVTLEQDNRLWGRFARFWENLYTSWLVWAYNPASLNGKDLTQARQYELWITRQVLLEKYLEKADGKVLKMDALKTHSEQVRPSFPEDLSFHSGVHR